MNKSYPMIRYYTEEYDEERRLTRTLKGRLEATRMKSLISTHLLRENNDTVADIGGGCGAYATWMYDLGYSVSMLDLIPDHVDRAILHGVSAVQGDARRLPWSDNQFGAALMAGPLYHLKERSDRKQALAELIRVTKPGAPLLLTTLNRYGPLIGSTVGSVLGNIEDAVRSIALTGAYDNGNGWMSHAYYHTHQQFREELVEAGLHDVRLIGVSGPGTWLGVLSDRYEFEPDNALDTAVLSAQIADEYDELILLSSMFAATAYTPE